MYHFSATLLLIFLPTLFIFLCSTANLSVSRIEWIFVNKSELVLLRLEPAGIEVGTNHFSVCRVQFEGQFYSGKVRINNDNYCYFPHPGSPDRLADFEVLNSPPGTTSWVPYHTYDNNTVNPIVTSYHGYGNDTRYVCRAKYENDVIPGTLYPSRACHIELCEREIRVENQTDIEILVVNMYGEKLGVTQVLQPPYRDDTEAVDGSGA